MTKQPDRHFEFQALLSRARGVLVLTACLIGFADPVAAH